MGEPQAVAEVRGPMVGDVAWFITWYSRSFITLPELHLSLALMPQQHGYNMIPPFQ
jgi:hypothetical protein